MKYLFQRTKRGDFYTHYFMRNFSICCGFKTFHFEINHLKTILMKRNYSLNFIDLCIKSFLNKLYTPKVTVQNVPKRDVFVKLPFLGSTSFQIQRKLQKLFRNKLTSSNLKNCVYVTYFKSEAFLPLKISQLRYFRTSLQV